MQTYRADLHIHSRYSRATSAKLNPYLLSAWARIKGISVLGTGDFTHPKWREELAQTLRVDEATGLYVLKDPVVERDFAPNWREPLAIDAQKPVRFMLQAEISSIYKRHGKVRKVHNLVYMPNLEAAEAFSRKLEHIGNLHSDGRPILGLDSRNLLEMVLEAHPEAFMVPAHIWTPWFSVFGSKSGFDSLEECFGDLAGHIFALETGLSSDPPMNRLVSGLDRCRLISNSDAHSGENLGREANVFAGEMTYSGILEALKHGPDFSGATRFLGTLEFFPEEGKYHMDGHRNCKVVLWPEETVKLGNICPVCGKPLTVGVLHRVMALADRKDPVYPVEEEFRFLIPLPELLGEILGVGPKTRKVTDWYSKALARFGSEMAILQDVPVDEISRFFPPLGEGVCRMRAGEVIRQGGYDGEYGVVRVFTDQEQAEIKRGTSLAKPGKTAAKVTGLSLLDHLEAPKPQKEAPAPEKPEPSPLKETPKTRTGKAENISAAPISPLVDDSPDVPAVQVSGGQVDPAGLSEPVVKASTFSEEQGSKKNEPAVEEVKESPSPQEGVQTVVKEAATFEPTREQSAVRPPVKPRISVSLVSKKLKPAAPENEPDMPLPEALRSQGTPEVAEAFAPSGHGASEAAGSEPLWAEPSAGEKQRVRVQATASGKREVPLPELLSDLDLPDEDMVPSIALEPERGKKSSLNIETPLEVELLAEENIPHEGGLKVYRAKSFEARENTEGRAPYLSLEPAGTVREAAVTRAEETPETLPDFSADVPLAGKEMQEPSFESEQREFSAGAEHAPNVFEDMHTEEEAADKGMIDLEPVLRSNLRPSLRLDAGTDLEPGLEQHAEPDGLAEVEQSAGQKMEQSAEQGSAPDGFNFSPISVLGGPPEEEQLEKQLQLEPARGANGPQEEKNSLNPEQLRAVAAGPGPVLVLAGPGTGKTRTLVARILHLLNFGISARRILAVTFTRRAASEMDSRLNALLDPEGTGKVSLPRTDTLHALALELWHKVHSDVPVLLSEDSARNVFRESNSTESAHTLREAWEAINLARERMEEPPEEYAEIATNYFRQKAAWNLADYTDLLEFWREQIVSGLFTSPWQHVLVDEVQDLSPLQLMIVTSLLHGMGDGFFGIGDPDQSIYGFRGAHGQSKTYFESVWPLIETVTLTRNYRSRPGILQASAAGIGAAGVCGPLVPTRTSEANLHIFEALTAESEASWIADRVRALVGNASHTLADSASEAEPGDGSFSPGDIAILVRTHALAKPLRRALMLTGLPIAEPSVDAFWSDPRVALIVNAAGRMLGVAGPELEEGETDPLAPEICPEKVLAKGPLGVAAFFNDLLPFDILFWKSKAFRALVKAYDVHGGWSQVITWINLQNEMELAKARAEKIQILSLHAAKGLEFRAVFMPCLEDGLMPFAGPNLLTGKLEKGEGPDVEEERRLFYVGMTRARDNLYLSHASRRRLYGREVRLKPSRFLENLPQGLFSKSALVSKLKHNEKQLSLI